MQVAPRESQHQKEGACLEFFAKTESYGFYLAPYRKLGYVADKSTPFPPPISC